jgi:hypothetical protein
MCFSPALLPGGLVGGAGPVLPPRGSGEMPRPIGGAGPRMRPPLGPKNSETAPLGPGSLQGGAGPVMPP